MERARSVVALQPHEPEATYLPTCTPRGTEAQDVQLIWYTV